MPPILKFLISMALIAALIVASPFIAEATLRAYDRAFDPYTHPGVITADGQAAKFGLNRRLFRENRFSFVSPEIRLELTGLAEGEAIHAPTPVRGTVTIYQLPSATNAVPGSEAPDGAEKLAGWAFRLEPIKTRPSSDANPHLIVAATAVDGQYDEAPPEAPPPTYDVLCALAPLSEADKAGAAAFPETIFKVGTPLEFDIDIKTDLPASNRIVFAYSRPTRSILRETALEPLYDRIASALGLEKKTRANQAVKK